MTKRWRIGVLSLIVLFVITNFTIYLKVYLDRKGEPLYSLSLRGDEIHFPYSNYHPEMSFSSGDLGLEINFEPWIESHSSTKALQLLGYCSEPSEVRRNRQKRPIFALIELGGPSYEALKERRKKEWEDCVAKAKQNKSQDPKACDWDERKFSHLSRLMLKDVFFDVQGTKPFESEKSKYLVLRGTLHVSSCPTNTITVHPYISLESEFSIPDQFKQDVDRAKKENAKTDSLEATIAVGHEYLLRLQNFKL